MTEKSIAIINLSSPYERSNAKDALDLALIMGSFELPPSLYFKGDGVYQLVNQTPEKLASKNFLKTFAAFEFYDIEQVYVCKSSLEARNLPTEFHIDNVKTLDKLAFKTMLNQHDTVFTF